jgi:hypothetical protein
MKMTRLTSFLLLIGFLTVSTGCKAKDPLAGWNKYMISDTGADGIGQTGVDASHFPDKAITDDYQAYIKTMPSDLSYLAKTQALLCFFDDGTGQHGIEITIQAYGEVWAHVLIYDKSDKRIKTIKYLKERYQS